MSEQSKAIELAKELDRIGVGHIALRQTNICYSSAAELRRLDAENKQLRDKSENKSKLIKLCLQTADAELIKQKGQINYLVRERDALRAQLAQGEPVNKASIWQQGYNQGVKDEETSAANIGIAGLGGKVSPARVNPYIDPQQAPASSRLEAAKAIAESPEFKQKLGEAIAAMPQALLPNGAYAGAPAVPDELAKRIKWMRKDFSLITKQRSDFWARECRSIIEDMLAAAKDGES